MELIVNDLRVPVEKDGMDEYLKAASERLGISPDKITLLRMLNKFLDISDKEQFFYVISIVAGVPDSFVNEKNFSLYSREIIPGRQTKKLRERPVIIGFGPAGMFAALELIEYGLKPLIFERGRKIEERSLDVRKFIAERELDPESNIQFGEGGAGSYSDGKLFSRINNSSYANKVLDTFIRFGAPEEIGYMRKPHLGTDVLCRIVRNIRGHVLKMGGEIHYRSKMTDILISENKVMGVVINGEKEYSSSLVYLALGHSARDTFGMLHDKGVVLEQKPVSVGVRVEHPAEDINLMRYGAKYKDFSAIGAATYSLNYTDRKAGRGVYTFCMCPGGEVINASSENGLLVVNGMSYSKRASAFSNSALVVTCRTEDYKSASPLAGLEFQKEIERKAFNAAGRNWKVPAQNLLDFLLGKTTDSLNKNSYEMGAEAVDMKELFPDFVGGTLLAAFNNWKTDYPLFVSGRGLLLGAETRTSSPVRIKRSERYESVNMENLYPIGEGSGYTGGITSSAADAIRAVEASMSGRWHRK